MDYNRLYADSVAASIPWDDRNLGLTKEQLDKLPPKDFEDRQNIPIFYRVELRENNPQLLKAGKCQYPRSGAERFQLIYGGFIQDGKRVLERKKGSDINLGNEVGVSSPEYAAETAIAINPVNDSLVIAGANGNGGQWHYYSNDGGATWTPSGGANPIADSCCDPTMAWSPDGTLAYGVTLGAAGGVWFYRSTDNGMNWTRTATISSSGADDKEYIHVDHYNCGTNPNCGNIYVSWHQGNVMRLARSVDNGQNFSIFVHNDSGNAIGSDVTSDASGHVYHFWPETSGTIYYAKSTDGGANFGSKISVANTNAQFEYPIPAMDSRNVFVYVSATTDLTGGTYHDRIYACWSDHDNASTGSATNNHSKIVVARSADSGQSWQFSSPHETNDIQTVDRFNPWMEVDGNGYLHVVYYDTRNDAQRRNPDMYHSISKDGGQTFETPTRITSVSSNYFDDGFQWGDYNGMAIVGNEVRPIWTDNRPGGSTLAYTREINVISDDTGDFSLEGGNNTTQNICRGGSLDPVQITVGAIDGFNDPVTFAFDPSPLPTGFSGAIENQPLTPPGTVTVTMNTTEAAALGATAIRVVGTSGSLTHDITLNLTVLAGFTEFRHLWRDANNFDSRFDLDGNGVIDVLDFVDATNCNQVPSFDKEEDPLSDAADLP
ncbi:sialidase family protein [Sulfidibacter corallicola]|uniref:Exo-alpha-sialidase n=1 Tax=Sulfidibacter corallicola TaxID=2818388 RepID=A0A8A4TIR2_SULCO|nr:sialidase family protein [Sulfidibacter corallicola]QTD49493.1 exo-alpha-sialidase [Sulfidibacter corallicola]